MQTYVPRRKYSFEHSYPIIIAVLARTVAATAVITVARGRDIVLIFDINNIDGIHGAQLSFGPSMTRAGPVAKQILRGKYWVLFS